MKTLNDVPKNQTGSVSIGGIIGGVWGGIATVSTGLVSTVSGSALGVDVLFR